ncbi:hypothetical protein AMTRI_Chr01g132060 [Amborella trichopoda]
MPQLHTSVHFHLTPIVMINSSPHHDLILNSQYFCRSIPTGIENPSLYRKPSSWGGLTNYPLRTWLPNVYHGYDNWYTRGASFPVLSYRGKVLSMNFVQHINRGLTSTSPSYQQFIRCIITWIKISFASCSAGWLVAWFCDSKVAIALPKLMLLL